MGWDGMNRIYLIRHGQTEWNRQNRYQGWSDVPLNDTGKQQAREVGKVFADNAPAVIYTSELVRAEETAGIIGSMSNIPVKKTGKLNELSFGEWEGRTHEEIARDYPSYWERLRKNPGDFRAPGGESVQELHTRVGTIWRTIREDSASPIIVVAHGGTLRTLILEILESSLDSFWRIRLDFCSISRVDTYDNHCIVASLNDTSHLNIG